jgi:uncharacterized membrane protein YfcA
MTEFTSVQELVLYLGLGSLAGLMAGLLGVGGGLVIVPVLIWAFTLLGFDSEVLVHLAVGTSLATIVVTSLSSIRAHHRRGAVRWELVRRLSPGILLGSLIGALVADWMSSEWLRRVFAVFVLIVGTRMLLGLNVRVGLQLPGPTGMWGAGGVIGAVSALVGIGGGSLTVPFLHASGVGMREAVATSSACGLPIALAGGLGFVWTGWSQPGLPQGSTGFVYWPAFAGIVLTSVLFAPLGARLAHRLPVRALQRVFAALLLGVGVKLLSG